MPSQWLAVEAGTDLRARARRIQRSWENLLAGGALNTELPPQATAELRPPIVDSWRRSLATGLDPTDLLPSIDADPSETRERWLEHPLGSFRHVLAERLQLLAQESNSLVQVTDPSGLTLHLDGPEWLKARAAEMNLVEGARCAETVNGTNGVGTALAADHPVQVFAFEHFSHHHRDWVCSGSPIHDPVSGRLVGVLDLSSPWKIAHPRSLELVTTAARTLEQCLLETRRDQDARLRRRYGDFAAKSTDLLVNREGYVLIGASAHPKPFDLPESGGEIAMDDGSLVVAEPLGQGEAYLVRRLPPPRGSAARDDALERAEERGYEEASGHAALRHAGELAFPLKVDSGRPSRESDRRVSAYFEAALDCVIMADASGRVVEFNPAAERTFGYSRDEALGRSLAELIVPPSLRERHSAAFARFVETGHGTVLGRRLELTGMRADGSEFPVELTLSQVEHEPLLICGALRDLSAAKQAESHLRELADEQAALRRVATLVARESSPQRLFALVAEQVARIIDVPLVRLIRYESGGSAAELMGGWSESMDPLALGTRWQLDGPGVLASVWRSRLPARLDDYTDVPGQAALVVRQAGMRSAVASPITVEGRLWGAIAVLSPRREPLPEGTEARLADFTELIATAISNTEARDGERRLAEEQAALRRVAELVAREASQVEVFAAVADAVSGLLGEEVRMVRYEANDAVVVAGSGGALEHVFAVGSRVPLGGNNAVSRVFRTGKPVRIDDYRAATGPVADTVSATGLRSVVATPIVVEGRLWGTMLVAAFREEPIAPQTESRLAQFTELVATALANAESRAELAGSEARARKLAEEQAALRRVATIIARESLPEELFAAVAEEVGRVMNVPLVALARYEPDGSAIHLVGGWSKGVLPVSIGGRYLLDGPSAFLSVWQTRKPARTGDSTDLPGEIAAARRQAGLKSSVASPILVEGRLWGVISVASSEPLPEDTDARLPDFTELVATAIANSEARDNLRRLADEQAALGRVATLVAKRATGDVLFAAVAREVAGLFGVGMVSIDRYENGESIVLASLGVPEFPVGSRWPLDGPGVRALVYETGRPARVDDFSEVAGTAPATARAHHIQSAIGVPIVVDGQVWGVLGIGSRQGEPLPGDVEQQLAAFTELVSTAIANSDARDHVNRLLDEQSALRRVATLVAEGASAEELFSAVAQEVAGVIGIPVVGVHRYEPDATFTMVGGAGESTFTVGSRWPVEDEGLAGMILASGRPARKDDYSTMPGAVGAAVRDDGMVSMVGVPIEVDGTIWGFMVAGGRPGEAIPAGAEEHLARFTELVATAVSNATMRAELAASRARVIAAADEARRRIERDLHDGAQQQLVALALGLRSAEGRVPAGLEDIRTEVGRFADRLTGVVEELREMSRGIHPAVLTEGGLSAAFEALALRSSVPVKLDVRCEDRFPHEVEVAAYYVVSEALTNAARYADASHVQIDLHAEEQTLRLSIFDDGSGGADPSAGSGLIGLKDRVEALSGTIEVNSPPGSGTRLDVEIPLIAAHSDSPRLSRV
ncbi:MAG: GAF domain-containing protein [Gaiellaceae bacterium]